ncbi:MAG: LamG-like jellyroll fold domain-containing protein, partial [Promethearchaeota archaeon]
MKNLKNKIIVLSISLILFSGAFYIFPETTDRTNNLIQDLNNDSPFLDEKKGIISEPQSTNGEIILSWWNESYQYRRRVEIKNTLAFIRDIPIDLYLDFSDESCDNESIRIVEYNDGGDTWTAIPSQVWNQTMWGATDYLKKGTITFVVDDFPASTTNIYYVYYDPDETFDPTDKSGNSFSSVKDNDKVTVEWDDNDHYNYNLSLDKSSGVYQLEDNYGKNYHTQNSSSPGSLTLTKDLIGYWNFDDETCEELTDNIPDGEGSGYILHNNSMYYDDGRYGKGLYSFDTDYIAINGNENLYGGKSSDNGITIMAWVNPSSSSNERIIASWDRSEYWRLSLRTGNDVLWATTTNVSAGQDDMDSSGTVSVDEWSHIAVTYNVSSGIKHIYINGQLDSKPQQDPVTPGENLGFNSPQCYGFIGTGSEASDFDGSVGPTSEWEGGLDEIRIYNNTLTQNEIQQAMNNIEDTTTIYEGSVEEVTSGDVLSIYNLEWDAVMFSDTNKMTVTDTFWFYRSLNIWKVNRTYKWNFHIMEPNNKFGAWNTLYNWDPYDDNLLHEDYYYYDNNMHEGHFNVDFTIENYTVLLDFDGTEHSTAVGLFISEKSKGATQVDFSELKWKIDVNDPNNIINFVPGNQTDLDNKDGVPADYTITVEFWEYIQNNFGDYQTTTASAANTHFNNMYQSLLSPLNITYKDEETCFFNLEVHIIDHDGNSVPSVNVSLNNVTNSGDYDEFVNDTLSDSNGNATFTQLPDNNYTVCLNYTHYDSTLWLGDHTFELNQTTITYLNTKAVTYTVNLTSLVLKFQSNNNTAKNITKS